MIRRLILAALVALFPALASAQIAFIAPTVPLSDNSNKIANTAWVNQFFTAGIPLASGKIFIGSVGGVAVAQTPSGDWTIANNGAATLATVNANVGTFGSTTQCITTTQNAKGLTTAISAATCTPAIGSITGLGTGVATALGVNVGLFGSFVTMNGVLGTPSSGTGTNITGLPISTGVSGLGTGIATALGVNVGTAGAPVVNGGALGTPSSGAGNNLTGVPIVPAGCMSAVTGMSVTGTLTETALGPGCTILGNTMGANGALVITAQFSKTGTAGSIETRLKFGGTTFLDTGASGAPSISGRNQTEIHNRNATNSQVGTSIGNLNWGTQATTATITTAIDTTANQNVTFTCQLGNVGDTCTLESFTVLVIRP